MALVIKFEHVHTGAVREVEFAERPGAGADAMLFSVVLSTYGSAGYVPAKISRKTLGEVEELFRMKETAGALVPAPPAKVIPFPGGGFPVAGACAAVDVEGVMDLAEELKQRRRRRLERRKDRAEKWQAMTRELAELAGVAANRADVKRGVELGLELLAFYFDPTGRPELLLELEELEAERASDSPV